MIELGTNILIDRAFQAMKGPAEGLQPEATKEQGRELHHKTHQVLLDNVPSRTGHYSGNLEGDWENRAERLDPRGERLDCDIPVSQDESVRVTLLYGPEHTGWDEGMETVILVHGIPEVLRTNWWNRHRIETRVGLDEITDTSLGSSLTRRPLASRPLTQLDIDTYTALLNVLERPEVIKTPSRFRIKW